MNTTQFIELYQKGYRTLPIEQTFFSDHLTPISIAETFQSRLAYLLESKQGNSERSRYSFIGLDPYASITEEDGQYLFKENDDQAIIADTFSSVYDKALESLKPYVLKNERPFNGGPVGAMNYETAASRSGLSPHPNPDLNTPKCHFVICKHIIVFDHKTQTTTIVSYARLDDKIQDHAVSRAFYSVLNQQKELTRRLQRSVGVNIVGSPYADLTKGDMAPINQSFTKRAFERNVEKIKNYIKSGDVFQTVLSNRFTFEPSVSAWRLYRVLRVTNPAPYLFYLNLEGTKLVGSSPERMVHVNHNRMVDVHPIAGTRRRGRTSEEDERMKQELLSDKKEQAEHAMLVDLARNDIGKIAEYGSVNVSQWKKLGVFPNVFHLVSKVTGQLKEDEHFTEALFASYPAGTLTGAPKIRAMEIIQELEPVARGYYGGAVGYLDFGGVLDTCIAIRTAIEKDGLMYVQTGAGIVHDSDAELEWKETLNKSQAMLSAMKRAEQMFRGEGDERGA